MVHLAIDVVEEAMLAAGQPPGRTTGVAAYEVAGSVAAANLALGSDVCVDAVNDSELARGRGVAQPPGAARRCASSSPPVPTPREHRRRLEGRTRPFTFVVEPTWADVRRRAQHDEPWTDPHDVIDTMLSPAVALEAAVRAIGRHR
jgi:predicted kinase